MSAELSPGFEKYRELRSCLAVLKSNNVKFPIV